MTRPAGPAGSPAEDGLLTRLYQQVTAQQASSLGAGYDQAAGLARYRSWLRQRTLSLDPDAYDAVRGLFGEHYLSLVRLASLLMADAGAGQDLVEEAFVAVHDAWGRLPDTGRALAYLRRCVVAGCRAPRGRASGPRSAGLRSPELAALDALPALQREAVILHYYAALPEAELASAMGVGRRSAQRQLTRARSALQGRTPGLRGQFLASR